MATGGMTVESVLGSIIQGHLECSICHTRYQEPKMLDCSHSFCLGCLQELHQSQKPDDDKITCPLCQRETILPEGGGVAKLTTNYGLMSLVAEVAKQEQLLKGEVSKVRCQACDEENEAISRCIDCEQFLCQQCQTAHQRFTALKIHKIVSLEEIEEESAPNTVVKKDVSKCDIHPNKELCFYCNTCEMLICKQCATSSHKEPTHTYSDLKTAVNTCLQEAREKQPPNRSVQENWKSLRERLHITFGETCSLIFHSAEEKIKKIKHKEQQLKLTAHTEYRKKDKVLAEMLVAEQTKKMVHEDITDANCREVLKFRQDLLQDLRDVNVTERVTRDLSFVGFKENNDEVELGSVLQKEEWELHQTLRITGDFTAAFSTGDIVIANTQSNQINRLSAKGKVLNVFNIKKHIASAVNKDDQLVVLFGEPEIMVLNMEYRVLNHFHPGKQANIEGKPTCLAVDDDNLIAVGYKDKQLVSVHNQDGTFIKTLPAPMIDKYLTISNKQLIYTNTVKKRLMVVDYMGNIEFKVDVKAGISTHGVCCDKTGDIYIVVHEEVVVEDRELSFQTMTGGTFSRATAVVQQKVPKVFIYHYSPQCKFIEQVSTAQESLSGITYTPGGKLVVTGKDATQIYRRV